MKCETWKVFPADRRYAVSDRGRVRRVLPAKGTRVGKILTLLPNRAGYSTVHVDKLRTVHSMVLMTFVGPRPQGMEACHHNDKKADNQLSNLHWGTHAENYAERVRNGGGNHGSRHGMAVLDEEKVISMRALYRQGRNTIAALATRFCVADETARRAINGRCWRHVQ